MKTKNCYTIFFYLFIEGGRQRMSMEKNGTDPYQRDGRKYQHTPPTFDS